MLSWRSDRQRRRPVLLEYRSAEWFILASVSIAIFTEIFLYGVIVPVIPFALQGRVGISSDETQKWTAVLLAVYAAFLLAFSPIAGWVADRTATRRLPLLVSLITFTGATFLLMFGTTIGALIAGRALQGASAAAVWSIGLALIVDTVGVEKVGEASGYVALSMSLGLFTGPLLGGVVYQKAGYYAVFYMCIGILILDIVLRLLIIEKRVAKQWTQSTSPEAEFEHTSEQTEAVMDQHEGKSESEKNTSSLLNPTSGTSGHGRGSPTRSTENEVSHLDTSVPTSHPTRNEYLVEGNRVTDQSQPSKTRIPAVVTLLSSRRLLIALWGTAAVSAIYTSFDTIIPLRVANLFGWDSIGAGLIFLAIVVPSFLSSLIGTIADRFGARLITTLGFLIMCPTLVCMRFVEYNSIGQKVLLCALLACAGGALSMLLVPLLAEITHCVESTQNRYPERFAGRSAYAQGYGMLNAAYAAGTLIGPLWSGFLIDRAGWKTTNWSLGLFAGVTALPMFLYSGGWIGERGWRAEMFHPRRFITSKNEGSTPSVVPGGDDAGIQV